MDRLTGEDDPSVAVLARELLGEPRDGTLALEALLAFASAGEPMRDE